MEREESFTKLSRSVTVCDFTNLYHANDDGDDSSGDVVGLIGRLNVVTAWSDVMTRDVGE